MKALKETIVLAIFFLTLATTYGSFSFIVTYMYEHKEQGLKYMGPVLLLVNFLSFMISNSFAPSLRMSLTTQMKVAAACYTTNYISQIPQFTGGLGITVSILGSILGGYGAALLWVCYGAYMKALCKKNHQEEIQGKYFAILNGIAFANILLGAILTTFCMELVSDQTYFIILAVMGVFSFIYCHFLIPQIETSTIIGTPHHWCKELKKSFNFYSRMTAIIPFLIFDGLVLGFLSTSSTNIMPAASTRVEIGLFLVMLGAGCILGGFLAGYLSDLIQTRNAGNLAILIVLVVSVITVVVELFKNQMFAYVCGFLWGIARQFMEGWLYVACSRNYNGRRQSYANMKQLHSFAFCIYQVIAITTGLKLQTSYFMLIFILLGPVSFYLLQKLPSPIEEEPTTQAKEGTISLESSSEDS